MSTDRVRDIETACEIMHDAYEKAAVGAGWETNQASRKPWADVPDANKATMRAAVGALLSEIAADWLSPDEVQAAKAEALDEVASRIDNASITWTPAQWASHMRYCVSLLRGPYADDVAPTAEEAKPEPACPWCGASGADPCVTSDGRFRINHKARTRMERANR